MGKWLDGRITLKTLAYLDNEITYTGSELSPHWIYQKFDLLGNALVAFIGEAKVELSHMVDIEDVKKKAPIYSPKMLHFVGEWFQDSWEVGILYQHLFVLLLSEALHAKGVKGLSRRGNDLYQENKKLNVSICTKTLSSTLIHVGINIDTEGTPVPTVGLKNWDIDPKALANSLLNQFSLEYEGWQKARCKVLPR